MSRLNRTFTDLKFPKSKSSKINDLARKLINESDYYYELEKEGNSPEYIFSKAQEEADEILSKNSLSGLEKLKDIERKINHIKEIVPEAKIEERQKILLRYFNRI